MSDEAFRETQTVGTIEIAYGDGIVRFGYQGSPPVFLVAFGTKAEALAARDARGMLELLRRIEYIDDGRCPACGGAPPGGDGPMYARHADEVVDGKLIPCRLGAFLDKHGRAP